MVAVNENDNTPLEITFFITGVTFTAFEGEDWYTWISRITLDNLKSSGVDSLVIGSFEELLEDGPNSSISVSVGPPMGSNSLKDSDNKLQYGYDKIISQMNYSMEW